MRFQRSLFSSEATDANPGSVRWPRRTIDAGVFWLVLPLLVCLVVSLPMMDVNRFWWGDAVNHLWLLIGAEAGGRPLWYFQPLADQPALVPWYLYYGGGPLSLAADVGSTFSLDALTLVRGLHVIALVASTFAIAGGMRMLGGPWWASSLIASMWASVPAHLVLTKGGNLAAYVAISTIPLAVIAVSLMLTWHPRRAAALVAPLAVLGWLLMTLHALTTLIIGTLLTVALLALAGLFAGDWVVRRGRRLTAFRQWLRVDAPAVRTSNAGAPDSGSESTRSVPLRSWLPIGVAFMAAAAFASPQIVPAALTAAGTQQAAKDYPTGDAAALSSLTAILDQREWLAGGDFVGSRSLAALLVWAVLGCFLSWPLLRRGRRLAVLLVASGLVLTLAVAGVPAVWPFLPSWLQAMQFPGRMVIYSTLLIITLAGVIAGSLLGPTARPQIRWVMAAGLALCTLVSVPVGLLVNATLNETQRVAATAPEIARLTPNALPETWYAGWQQFAPAGTIDPSDVSVGDFGIRRFTATSVVGRLRCTGSPATEVAIATAPPLVRVTGLPVLGSTTEGLLVLDTRSCPAGAVQDVAVEQVTDAGWQAVAAAAAPWVGITLIGIGVAWSARWPGTEQPLASDAGPAPPGAAGPRSRARR